ncbi:MAG: glycosyltransferase family 4 protein [Spirochaetaceae bacterium]|jgi:glycosyltransferase involved in cell wall biosynthesis|nr:glycosyltransferase family 4 protein [Spirochaetaceae bacterium]
MTITIDCRMLHESGIGVYLRECLPWFFESGNAFLLLGDGEKLAHIAANHQNVEIVDCTIRPFSIGELAAFPQKILKKINRTALFYSPYFNIPGGIRVPVYTTIHDIIFPDMPELTSKVGLAARMGFYRRAFRRSRKIFTVSQFSKSRIEYYSRNSVPVIVTYSAIQPHLIKHGNVFTDKKNTVLFIGNIKKHKGLSILLDAFLATRKEGLDYKLVIVGGSDKFRSRDTEFLKKLDSASTKVVDFTGFIPQEHCTALLSSATLLVQPSLYEGFGLPPLEAMTLGTRALISDIPVFKEIYGDFPVTFFRAGDCVDLKEKLSVLLEDRDPQALVLPPHLAEKYTFQKTASIILQELGKP